jgi:hypothetical protein
MSHLTWAVPPPVIFYEFLTAIMTFATSTQIYYLYPCLDVKGRTLPGYQGPKIPIIKREEAKGLCLVLVF